MKQITEFVETPKEKTISEVFVSVLGQRRDYDFHGDYFQRDLDGYGSLTNKVDLDAMSRINLLRLAHNRTMLQMMLNEHEPELWIFGHHHRSVDQYVNNCRFKCLAELETFEIEI